MVRSMTNVVVDWSEIKQAYIDGVEHGKDWDSQPYMARRLRRYYRRPHIEHNDGGGKQKNWEGGTPAQTVEWTHTGFHAERFQHAAEMVPKVLRRRATWNRDEGDVDPGRLYAGRDDFFLGMQKREAKPGLHLQVEFAFSWTVSSETIQEYGAWVAGLIYALEASGHDVVVDLWVPLNGLFVDDTNHVDRTNILIRVKRPNEVSDFTEWSALFAPTGYRHLGFTAHAVAADKLGKVVAPWFGITIGGKSWGVDYDRDDQTVMITCNQRAGGREKFPKALLNRQAIAVGLLPDPEQFA